MRTEKEDAAVSNALAEQEKTKRTEKTKEKEDDIAEMERTLNKTKNEWKSS